MNEHVDTKATYFGRYDETKARIVLEIKLPQEINRGRKRIEKIIKNSNSSSSPFMITNCKGDDIEDEDEEDEAEEEKPKEEEPPKKKGKVIITKHSKSSPIIFTTRTTKSKRKLKLGEEVEAK